MSFSGSPVRTLSNNYDMPGLVASSGMSSETLEKSLTNLNIHIANIAAKHEELDVTLKEFCANFNRKQEIMAEETKQLRIEMAKLRKNTNHGA